MKVSEILPKVKANKTTYFNLSQSQANDFRKLYGYLKKHKNKEVDCFCERLLPEYLSNKDCDYLVKYYTMTFVSTHIKH